MKFTETPVSGAYVVEIEPLEDERGFFARSWCSREWERRGLNSRIAQCNISFNQQKGTLRGLHYQVKPHEEAKLIRCTSGMIYDVILDLRDGSGNFLRWFGVELNDQNRRMLYVPEGVAHGFVTLADRSEVLYQMSFPHAPESARGIRWNDPAFGIVWPLEPRWMSERDASFPLWPAGRGGQ